MIRQTNQKLIVDAVRQKEVTTRSEISKMLNLSVPSVCANVDQLLAQGVLKQEASGGDAGVGRKAGRLRLNDEYGYVVSIDCTNPRVKLALSNLKPQIMRESAVELELNELSQAFDRIMDGIDALLAEAGIAKERLLAVAIAVPGTVNADTGIVDCGSYLNVLGTVHLRELMQERFPNTPIFLQNDINAAVVGELRYGAARGRKHAIYISVDIGVGSGLVLDGKLHSGNSHIAGEIASFVMNLAPLDGDYSRKNELQQIVSIRAITEAIVAETRDGGAVAGGTLAWETIVDAVAKRDPLCTKHVERSARIMGIAVSNVMALLDLELVIIGGRVVQLGDMYVDAMREEVEKLLGIKPGIVYTELGDRAVLYGGIAVAMGHVFEHIAR